MKLGAFCCQGDVQDVISRAGILVAEKWSSFSSDKTS